MSSLFLGIDTSNYTTSLAVCNENGVIVEEQRRVLTVASGERGLRQSEAVFQHVKNLPELFDGLETDSAQYVAVGVSTSPRPVEGSYMPVFRTGEGMAKVLSHALKIPLVSFSHQEGHIRSAIYGCGIKPKDMRFPILATHFSGGTSELLLVEPKGQGYECEIIGKTLDLNGGQLVDRVGVAMGLSFPAGKALEALARNAKNKSITIKSTVTKGDFHFSGLEQQAMALLSEGVPREEVAYSVFRGIAKTLEKAVRYAASTYGVKTVLFSGGVMANGIIREILCHRLAKGFTLHFTKPAYATDNAVGISLLTKEVMEYSMKSRVESSVKSEEWNSTPQTPHLTPEK